MKEIVFFIGRLLIVLITVIILDSLWHPFPAEYHFAWWFLWFQLSAFFTWDGQYPLLSGIGWVYTIWLSVRGLPLSQNWETIWNPFFRGILGTQRVKHWENWSDRSYYIVYQNMEQIHPSAHTQQHPQPILKPILKQNPAPPVLLNRTVEIPNEEPIRQDDEMSVTADFSFDLDIDQVKAAMQEINEPTDEEISQQSTE